MSDPLMVINKKPCGGPELQVACLMVREREKISANEKHDASTSAHLSHSERRHKTKKTRRKV